MKTPKERETPDLLELVVELHARGLNYPSKEMHDAYWEARRELESRIVANKISSNVSVIRRLPTAEEIKRWYQLLTGKGEFFMKTDMEATFV